MSDMIPFDFNSNKLPAHLQNSRFKPARDMVTGEGFPIVSIKGKVFTHVNGDVRKLITAPGTDDEPARSLEVVVVNYNKGVSKVFYETTYTEGSDAKPTCYSNDGNKPAADAEAPQSKSCATCPHNQWGSRITENGAKGKACSDSRRLAISPAGHINEPMLLRVPATSLKALSQYQDLLFKRGVAVQQVVTKIGFDYSVAHPSLTFKAIGILNENQLDEVEAVYESSVVLGILGKDTDGEIPFEAPAAAPVAAPKAKAKVAVEEDDEPEEAPAPKVVKKKAKVVVEEDDEPEEAPAPKPKKAAAAVEVDDDLVGALDNLLDDDDDFAA